MPTTNPTLAARDWIDEARRVSCAYNAICDLTIGDGAAPMSDDCFGP